jgi:glycosyltransferase involved in cell wall biosynthesis
VTRVAIVNDVAGVGSLQTRILNQAGDDAAFIDLPKPGGSWPLYAKVFTVPVRLAQYVPIVRKLRRGDYDLIHIHFLSHGFIGPLIGKPFVLHGHGHDVHTNLKNPFYRALSHFAMKRARAIYYVTPDLAPFLTDFADKSYLLPNPLEPMFFANVKPPTDLRKLLFFTRLYPIKGPEEVFGSTPELARFVDVSAISWGPLGPMLRERFGHAVHFIDRVPREEVPSLIDSFDGVIGQMKLGILSLSELEAMARGRVVFMRLDRSLYPDDPPPVVDISDGPELVEAVQRLQQDPDELRRLSDQGRDWVARHHSVDGFLRVLRRGYGVEERIEEPSPVPVG